MLRSVFLIATAFTVAAASAVAGTAAPASASLAPSVRLGPAATPQRQLPLTRVYRGSDGGVLYLRQVGSSVYGFGEHPGVPYAYVLSGSIKDNRISGSWWDVPKGLKREVSKGSLDLQWSQNGARIVRKGGDDLGPEVLTAIDPTTVPWPNMRAASFQATSPNDLTGAYVGDDGSRHYARETASNTVWVAERASQPGERPGWVSVFVGKRKGTGFAGTFVDVPKGIELGSGTFGAAFVGSKRELVLKQVGADRTRRLAPDYAFDHDRFVAELAGKLDRHVVGYAFALAHSGAVLREHAWGSRRAAIDGGALPFTPNTKSGTASAMKTVNATAIVKALNDRGLGVDSKVAPFLPSCIKQGPGVSTLTFRQILNHTSGLRGARGFDPEESCNGRDPYECLLDVLAKGRIYPREKAYNNKAYDLLRFLVPLVSETTKTKADFALFDCKDKAGVLNRRLSARFAGYILDKVLRPVGSDASWYPSGDYSLNYNCNAGLVGAVCSPNRPGEAMTKDYYLRAGSGKTAMSAVDYVRFLSALDRGLIIPKNLVETMKGTPGDRLGFDTTIAGKAGGYHWKNGGCPSLDRTSWDRGCSTLAIVFPGDFQVYVTINSSHNTYSGSLMEVVRDAFDASLR
jgi:Beta-lactamase